MTRASDAGNIRRVLSGPGVTRTFAFAMVGRLTYGLLPLCLLFTVRDASDSFAVAAASLATLGFATLAMPIQARLIDRFGQRRVLPCYAICYAVLLIATGLIAAGSPPDGLWILTGLLLGLSAPALGPSMRAQWREIAAEGPPRRVAYSLDSVAEESLYLVGPLAASVVLATGPARLGLFVAAGLISVGTAGLVTSPHVPVPASGASVDPRSTSRIGVLRRPGLGTLLVVMAMIGTAGAACFVGVAAIADDASVPDAVGVIEAGIAVGAIVGGLIWARLKVDPPWMLALGLLTLISAVIQLTAAMAAPNLVLVGAFLIGVGAVSAPVFVVAFTGGDGLVATEQRTEASTLVSTALNAGNALGTALAGPVLSLGLAAPFSLAACLSMLATAIALSQYRRTRRDVLT